VRLRHRTVKRVSQDLKDFQFNTMVAALIEYVNELKRLRATPVAQAPEWRDALRTLVLLMAPSTPYVAEELWERLGEPFSVHTQQWPVYDEAMTREDVVELVVQVNGRMRDKILLPPDLDEPAALEQVMALDRVREQLTDLKVARVIYVPGRLVNIVAK